MRQGTSWVSLSTFGMADGRTSQLMMLSCYTIDEFQASSKELEDELERELAATDKTQAELRETIKRLEAEKDEWKVGCRPLVILIKLIQVLGETSSSS